MLISFTSAFRPPCSLRRSFEAGANGDRSEVSQRRRNSAPSPFADRLASRITCLGRLGLVGRIGWDCSAELRAVRRCAACRTSSRRSSLFDGRLSTSAVAGPNRVRLLPCSPTLLRRPREFLISCRRLYPSCRLCSCRCGLSRPRFRGRRSVERRKLHPHRGSLRGQWNVEELFRRARKGGVAPWGPSHQWSDNSLRLHTFATVIGLELVSLARLAIGTFMLRPEESAGPSPSRAFTFDLSPPKSPQRGVEYNYAGKQFPRPDFHRQDKQPYGLRATVREPVLEYLGAPDRRHCQEWSPST
jgi:hypothetical protein